MLFKRTHVPTDRTLRNRQLFSGTGKRAMPRRRFKCAKGIKRRKTTGHSESSYGVISSTYQKLPWMSFNHAIHPFYPFVQTLQSAENRRFPVLFDPERDDHAASSAY
jgi:hypothetical protein